jgi:DNA-binding CsgD family transcriptional regulator
VSIEGRESVLAGLVSEDAEALYSRLVTSGSLPIGTGPDAVDLDSPATRELLDAQIAYRSPDASNRIVPLAEATALRLLLSRDHQDLMSRQRRLLHAWGRLDSVLSLAMSRTSASSRADHLVEVITRRDAVSRLSAELYQATRTELLGLVRGPMAAPVNDAQLITPATASGVGGRFRLIYDSAFAANDIGGRIIEQSVAAGEEARIRQSVPVMLLHVDDTVALVSLTLPAIDNALLVRSPPLLAALRDWFELLWDDPKTTTVGVEAQQTLTPAQRQILRLLASGMGDEAIARALGTSVRTVRRHITALLELLGVNSRFAAGAAAAKRGWI